VFKDYIKIIAIGWTLRAARERTLGACHSHC